MIAVAGIESVIEAFTEKLQNRLEAVLRRWIGERVFRHWDVVQLQRTLGAIVV